jgi:hypothetical protein
MSDSISVNDVKRYNKSVTSYVKDNSYKGIIISAVIAVVILIVAFFMNIVKWGLVIIALIIVGSVGVRLYNTIKDKKT